MKLRVLKVLTFPILILLPFIQSYFSSCAYSSTASDSTTWVHSIDLLQLEVQREKTKFTLTNSSTAVAHWEFKILRADNGKVVQTSTHANPSFSLPIGTYDVLVTATGKNILTRHYRRYITVLPKVFSERDADEVIDLSKVKTNSLIKDFGNKVRPGYKIVIKGAFKGRVRFTGLRGTKKKPVHIINKGQVSIHAENNSSPYAFQWSDDNQYILLDGKADPEIPYGFVVTGHPEKSGQIFFVAGVFNKGFEMCGFHLIGRQGQTHGASAIQVQTAYTKECNAENWNFEYFKAHHNKIENASSEGMYIGYFTDEVRDTGFVPFRMGQVLVYRDSILNSGWDGIQIASADEFEVHDNYVDGASLSGKRSHSSFFSWNSGNAKGWCYRNTFKNAATAISLFYGETGKEAYIYSNLFVEGTYPEIITSVNFFFSKINNEFQDPLLYIFNNTIITSRIPVKIDYRNQKPDAPMPVIFAGNAIVLNRINKKKYPDIAFGSNLTDSASWTVNNVWRMKEQEHELKWTEDFYPQSDSPLLGSDFTISKYMKEIRGGFYDRDGYPLFHDKYGYTYGCYSAYQRDK
ncbi:MAG TPA: hypothetical protein VD884_21425 [Ohtaekwangia sp.]|nr:hypothetical protein [Ohtaekwangia sp.]